jgi:hypothetical protein
MVAGQRLRARQAALAALDAARARPEEMTMPTPLSWAGFGFMALAIVAGGLVKVDFHSAVANGLIMAAIPIFTALAGLCMHPPWATPAAPPPAPPPEAH